MKPKNTLFVLLLAIGGVGFNPALAQDVKLDLSSIFSRASRVYKSFTEPLPEGQITLLSHIPFDFSKAHIVFVNDTTVSVETVLIADVTAVHFLINTAFTALKFVQPNTQVGKITLIFDATTGGGAIETPLIVGVNIRQWRQVGDCGPSINTIVSPQANLEYTGLAPNACDLDFTPSGKGLAVIDRLSIPVPPFFQGPLPPTLRTLSQIVVEDTYPGKPAIFFNAITVERGVL